ncbi:glutamate 5-kinase [Streptomyces sp. NPDC057908]|uniref:glutamate 5-kinase n=1 Tax=Streptomyces sp. NPDC057908 TaxID=3346276 RepID=UPI0036EF8170
MSLMDQRAPIVIKIGTSSLISAGRIDQSRMVELSDTLAALHAAGHRIVLVASGAIALGNARLRSGAESDPVRRQLAAALGQNALFDALRRTLESAALTAAQFLLTPVDLTDDAHRDSVRGALQLALDEGVIPLVNENDAVMVRNNDVLAALLGTVLNAQRVVILTDVPGLHDSNPHGNDDARLIPVISEMSAEIERLAGISVSAAGTGGMLSKLCAAWISSLSGVEVVIASASEPNAVVRAVNGDSVGTLVRPRERNKQQDIGRLWRAFSTPPAGQLMCDSGAEQVVRQEGSLLGRHVVNVEGEIRPGDIANVLLPDGRLVARGRSRLGFSSSRSAISTDTSVLQKCDYVSFLED